MKWKWILKQCTNSDEGDKSLINIKQWTTIGHSCTRHNNHNCDFKINSAMILTYVFVYCNNATVAGNINNCVIIFSNDVVRSRCIGRNKDKCIVNMWTTYDVTEQCYGLGLCKYYNIWCIDNNAPKKENNSEYDIIQIIFKWCES